MRPASPWPGGVRRRRLQSAVIVVMVALASATITLGLNLLLESRSPYDRAFEAQKGAHLKVFYDARRVTPGQLASTPERRSGRARTPGHGLTCT